jgi:hypothetical protein
MGDLTTGIKHDLPALREWWGGAYEITWDCQRRVFRAVRKDNGTVLEDPSADALWDLIYDDCRAAPVIVREP